MGYRHYLYAIPKKQIAEIQACKTNSDLIDFAKRYGYNVDYDATDSGEGWIPPHDIGTELYELGKHSEIGHELESEKPCVFTSEELKNMYDDYGFALLSKDDFIAIIESYRQNIVSYFQNLLEPQKYSIIPPKSTIEEQWKYYIEDKLERWQGKWGSTPLNLEENTDRITNSWLYEYSIFELVRLYKTFDWENDNLVLMGW